MKYTHPLTTIAPDRSHTIELINNVQDKTNDLAYYINKLSDLAETIQRNTKWTKKVYLGGAKPQTLTGEVIFNIEHFIADVENDYHGDCMTPYRRHATNPRRCIHCQGTHASEDHHYLFQFLLCLIQVILAYRRLRNRLRQTRTITHLTSIRIRDSHYRLSNLPSPPHNNNNDHGLYLPDQPCLLRPIVYRPGPPPPHPPGNHGFPTLPVAYPLRCRHTHTARYPPSGQARKGSNPRVPPRGTTTDLAPQEPPRHG
jgi:hypothetical protein